MQTQECSVASKICWEWQNRMAKVGVSNEEIEQN